MAITKIPFRGLETQMMGEYSSEELDGRIRRVKNLIPYGANKSEPNWMPQQRGSYSVKGATFNLSDTFGVGGDEEVLGVYWHDRDFKEAGSTKTDTQRFIVVVHFRGSNTVRIYVTKIDSGEHVIDGDQIGSGLGVGDFSDDLQWVKFTKINSQDVAITFMGPSAEESHTYFMIGDNLYNSWLHPNRNEYAVSTRTEAYSAADYPSGGYQGYLGQADNKYVSVILCWKIKTTGTFIHHSNPYIVDLGAKSTANTHVITISELAGNHLHQHDPDDRSLGHSVWKDDEVEGPLVALTIGYYSLDDVLNTGSYFVVGKLDDFTLGSDGKREITVAEDIISSYPILNVDNYSRHRISGGAIGNYRNNLLMGDLFTDFAEPAAEWWRDLSDAVIFSESHGDFDSDPPWTPTDIDNIFVSANPYSEISPASTGSPKIERDFTPKNTSEDIVITIDYTLQTNGACTVDVEGAGIVDDTGNALVTSSGDPDETTHDNTLTITIPAADISSTADITLEFNLTYASPGTSDSLKLYNVIVTQSGKTLRTDHDIVEAVIQTKDGGTYSRYQNVYFYEESGETTLPDMISYPDQRAIQVKVWRYDSGSGSWYVIVSANLKPHDALNMAYEYKEGRSFTNSELGTQSESVSGSNFNYSSEDEDFRESGKWRAASLNEFDWPLIRYYEDPDSRVTGFVDNTSDIGEGQFGIFPLYILCKEHIYGAQSSAEALVAKTEVVTNNIGVRSQWGFITYRGYLWFASDHGIHRLRGNTVEDLHHSLKAYAAIDFSSEITGLDGFVSGMFNPVGGVVDNYYQTTMAFNDATDEVLISNSYNRLFVFNLEFETIYEGTMRFETNDTPTYLDAGALFQIGTEAHAIVHFAPLNDFNDNFCAKWREGNDDIDVEFETMPFTLGDYGFYKKIRQAILRGRITTPTTGSFTDLVLTLEGKKSGEDWEELAKYTLSDNLMELINPPFRSHKGSKHQFRFRLEGAMEGSFTGRGFIKQLDVEYINRGRLKV